MSNYTWKYIQKHPRDVKRLLGIDFEQLQALIEQGKFLHQKSKKNKKSGKLE